MSVVIETTVGSLTVDLYTKERPQTCLNFLKLCKLKYYNLCPFHEIKKDFIAQTGEQIHKGRKGGESLFYFIYGENGRFYEPELKPKLSHDQFGTLSMVTSKEHLAGSQFFITLGAELDYLDPVHTVFGRVVEGFEVLQTLNELPTDPDDKPYRDVLITHTVILHDPFDDPPSLEFPPDSPLPPDELLESDQIYTLENYDPNAGKTQEELDEERKLKDAKANAVMLEIVGDLETADDLPPENVLFVCKLNPVTRAEDLEVIFSRFGPIRDCEVICDHITGESLQYAFIGFEKREDCEKAYFKMDNVLIDDRRIHVDFSQSVAKYKWERMEKRKTKQAQAPQNQPKHSDERHRRVDGYNRSDRFDNKHERYGKRRRSRSRDRYKVSASTSSHRSAGEGAYRERKHSSPRYDHRDNHRDVYRKDDYRIEQRKNGHHQSDHSRSETRKLNRLNERTPEDRKSKSNQRSRSRSPASNQYSSRKTSGKSSERKRSRRSTSREKVHQKRSRSPKRSRDYHQSSRRRSRSVSRERQRK